MEEEIYISSRAKELLHQIKFCLDPSNFVDEMPAEDIALEYIQEALDSRKG